MTSTVPALGGTDVALSADGQIEQVPLFGGLSHEVIIKLVVQAQTVTLLTGDIVIGQNEKGSTLNLLMYFGMTMVLQRASRNCLKMNSGEAALVGAKTRTATITAAVSLPRLRLPRRNVLALTE